MEKMDKNKMENFKNKVKFELMTQYNIKVENIDALLEAASFYDLLYQHPEIAMYQSPIDWAREVAEDIDFYTQ